MTVVALFSDKGSPGVTTVALGLAHAWPRPVVLIELDPAGGDLALRLTDHAGRPLLNAGPGLLTFAAAIRRDPSTALTDHAQQFAGWLMVPGLATLGQARGMANLWAPVTTALTANDRTDVIVDLGRLGSDSPVIEAAAAADVLLGVSRAEPGSMLRMRDRLQDLGRELTPGQNRRLGVALVAEDRTADEARDAMQRVLRDGAIPAQLAGVVAVDARGVAAVCTAEPGVRLERSPFMRSVRGLVDQLVDEAPMAVVPRPRRLLAWSR